MKNKIFIILISIIIFLLLVIAFLIFSFYVKISVPKLIESINLDKKTNINVVDFINIKAKNNWRTTQIELEIKDIGIEFFEKHIKTIEDIKSTNYDNQQKVLEHIIEKYNLGTDIDDVYVYCYPISYEHHNTLSYTVTLTVWVYILRSKGLEEKWSDNTIIYVELPDFLIVI